MATDAKAIQNQKVFITLEGVLHLQDLYRKAKQESLPGSTANSIAQENARHCARTLEKVIDILSLPICKG